MSPAGTGDAEMAGGATAGMKPWRFVIWFGTVSMLADVVYEGARSVTGPLPASLGVPRVVGAVTGAGEAAALVLRLASGPLAGRWRAGRGGSGRGRSAAMR